MFCGDRCSPTDYDRRGNACDNNRCEEPAHEPHDKPWQAVAAVPELSWWCQRPTEEANREEQQSGAGGQLPAAIRMRMMNFVFNDVGEFPHIQDTCP